MIMSMLMSKLFYCFCFHFIHFLFIIFPASFQYMLDLRHRNNREEFREQEITGKEQPKCSHIKTNLPDSRCIISTPGTGQVITIHRSNDDHKTLEPHTDIHQDTHEESNQQVSSHFPEPEYLRRQYVTTHHDPVAPAIRTVQVHPVFLKSKPFIVHMPNTRP